MKRFCLGCSCAGAALMCFSLAGTALSQDISPPGRPTQQELQEIQSTYIVRFGAPVDSSQVEGRANAIAARFNGQIKYTYNTALNGFAIRMSEQALRNLARSTGLGIVSITRDAPVSAYAPKGDRGKPPPKDNGGGGGGGSCPETLGWNIPRITTMVQSGTSDNPPCTVSGSTQMDYSGYALRVCVIDTGVSPHPDLNVDPYNLGRNYTNDKGGSEDLNGHGSHVAGIIGAIANNDQGVVGVAPGIPVIPIKVLNRRGSGSFSGVIKGVDYAASIGCDIANMSLGGETSSTSLDDAVKGARDVGVVFALAAGNSLADIVTHSPARASTSDNDNIFTIASFGQSAGNDVWSYFSNYDLTYGVAKLPDASGMVDFALPGGSIESTWKDDGYNTISGTSMASPHMAGLLVRLFTGTPSANPANCPDKSCTPARIANTGFTPDGTVTRIDYYTKDPEESYPVAADK